MPFGMKAVEAPMKILIDIEDQDGSPMPFGMKAVEAH